MTSREYAAECGIEIIGKLTKKVDTTTEWDYFKGEEIEKKVVYYVDENGTEISRTRKGGWCLVTKDGTVY